MRGYEYAVLFLPLVGSLVVFRKIFDKILAEISTSLFVCVSAGLSIFIFWNGSIMMFMEIM